MTRRYILLGAVLATAVSSSLPAGAAGGCATSTNVQVRANVSYPPSAQVAVGGTLSCGYVSGGGPVDYECGADSACAVRVNGDLEAMCPPQCSGTVWVPRCAWVSMTSVGNGAVADANHRGCDERRKPLDLTTP